MKKKYVVPLIFLLSITPVFADSILPLSYGIPILLLVVILIEILVFWLLNKKIYKKELSIKKIILIVLLANLVSSFLGVFIEFYTLQLGSSLDFLSNFVISVVIELFVFLIALRKTFNVKDLLTICIIANVFSYAFIFFSYSYLTQRPEINTPMSLKQSIAMQTQFKIENATVYQNNVNVTIKNIGTVNIDLGNLEFYISGNSYLSYVPNSGNLTPNSSTTIEILNMASSCSNGALTIVDAYSGLQDSTVISGCTASESIQGNNSSNAMNQVGINQSYYHVNEPEKPTFNIKVDPLTKNITPNEYFEYVVTIYGLNNSTKNVNTSINYTITSVDTNDLIAESSEWIIINSSLTFNRKLLIPSNATAGLYTIEAKAYYNNSLAASVGSFNVT